MKKKDKNGRACKPKAIESVRDQRTLTILKWLEEPLTRQEILERGRKEFKLETRQIDAYIHKAKEILKVQFLEELENNRSIIVQKFWKVYNRAMEGIPIINRETGEIDGYKPDLSAANNALKNIAQIQCLLTNKVELELPDNDLDDVPTDILLKYLEELGNNNKNQ